MHLMIENCLAFNKIASYHNKYALTFRTWWLPEMDKLMLEELGRLACARCTAIAFVYHSYADNCVGAAHHRYCCAQRRLLSAEVYRCRGGTCFIQVGVETGD